MADAHAYIRVSSQAQNLATQRASIERAAAVRGDVIVHWYMEKRSAKTISRPELERLRDDARQGKIAKLYVYRLDRLARTGIADMFAVVEGLRGHGTSIISLADGFSLDGPAAEVILAVIAWAAKMERIAINERISAARERVEAEGGKWGRPERFDGSQKEQIIKMHTEGRTVREISMAVKAPKSTVGRVIAAHKHAA